ncbi:hypothetical protein OHU11_17635 [Streptomyces sp. NBC_00257]|uniref:hypothetical protein n=1 Tax=unclassified Streptomyces TaxID=2593676 RepID=UPI00224FACFF|nr:MULTISPECIES: hypothetical protein [unclassified Streptomyces]MCX5429495.1 hypothetical protein [Streptomyces sp. NBC_00062]WTB56320.1 hypothetical protein OG832_25780 [Streptomyces sp. NBC_00826]WTH90796.1 hypothetical protein OIC43_17915 [Streptomyces sp. NBC_00825]WTH99522.1 hypothetical protein OHA23_17900 [Streptomyces sp. NBC_00822]
MADERYEWLDKDAAERLLRGEPVDPVGGRSCTDAERLVAALEAAARATRPATAELPGEAAALTAFRTAGRSARAGTRANAEGRSAGAEALDPVLIGAAAGGSVPYTTASAATGRTRSARWSRPVRFGLVASLAGCALGGVAVAAGTGMLPGPFGGNTPLPAASVSSEATPEELGSGLTTDETAQPPPSASPKGSASKPPASPSAPAENRDHDRSGTTTEPGGGDKRKPGGAATGSPGGTRSGKQTERPWNEASGDWYAKALQACRDYRDGKLSEKRRQKLEALANGARNLDRFCDRVIERSEPGRNDQGDDDGQGENGQGENGSSWNNSGSAAGLPSSVRFAEGVRIPPAPASLTPSARTSGAGSRS